MGKLCGSQTPIELDNPLLCRPLKPFGQKVRWSLAMILDKSVRILAVHGSSAVITAEQTPNTGGRSTISTPSPEVALITYPISSHCSGKTTGPKGTTIHSGLARQKLLDPGP